MIDINTNARPLKMQPEGLLITEQPIRQNSFPAREDVPNVLPSPLQKVWDELAAHPVLGEVAEVHGGSNYPLLAQGQGNSFFSPEPFPGGKHGIAQMTADFEPYRIQASGYLKSPSTQPSPQLLWEKPKVLAHVDCSPNARWPIVAAVDEEGLLCTQDFFAIWPTGELPVEVLAAILNGPIANAWLSTHNHSKRDIKRLLMQIPIPVPDFGSWMSEEIALLVREYRKMRREWESAPEQVRYTGKGHFERIGPELLGLYRLSMAAERELVAFFAGYRRPGPFPLAEIRHSREHRMADTMLHVEGMREEGSEKVLDVFVYGWEGCYPDKVIALPLSLVPPGEREKVAPHATLWAKVNTGAPDQKHLVFEDIEVAPEVSEEFDAKFALPT